MSKTSQSREREIGGFDDGYLDKLNPKDPDFLEKYYEAVTRPMATAKDEQKS
jgi:hypothetical protein